MKIDSLVHASGLAVGLAQDTRLRVRRGRWAYNPWEHTLQLGLGVGQLLDPQHRGLIGHEIAHVRITHYQRFQPGAELPLPIWADLLNALEDPRANTWFRQTFPGAGPWMDAVFAADRATIPPCTNSRFLQFTTAASIADAWSWQLPRGWSLAPPVAAALLDTIGARRRYATEELPNPALERQVDEQGLVMGLRREVEPILKSNARTPLPQTRREAIALISAARAYGVFCRAILPVAARLVAFDLSSLSARTRSDGRFRRELESALALQGTDLKELVERALADRRPADAHKPGVLEHAAYGAFVSRRGGLRHRLASGGSSTGTATAEMVAPMRGGHRDAPKGLGTKIEQMLQTQLPPLAKKLEVAFRQPAARRDQRGFPTGSRLDLRAALRFSIGRRDHDRLWMRVRPLTTAPEAAVCLLVDLSGSMAGAEIEAAILGTTLLARSFARLGPAVSFAILGFQNVLIPFKRFDQPTNTAILDGLRAMALEVAGTRNGGNNEPSYNDDGPCLRQAAAQLMAQSCPQRLLIVVSDGRPEGKNSNAQDLHAAVTAVSRSIHLVGLGLGSGTEHVKEFYPHAVADIPTEEFAQAIGTVVLSALNRGPQ
jgi:hypothetical protein